MSTLSVIIPTLNEERHIGALLSDVASQTRRPDEVLIVDASSADGSILGRSPLADASSGGFGWSVAGTTTGYAEKEGS
jgi:cellulose synthase/poly-beta-1,6-N-acetylglucosamine synthase-like glycosyltransferase